MNEVEARLILARHLERYHLRSYAYLATATCLGRIESVAVGKYQINVEATWENAPEGDVKVVGSISDGRSRITEEFNVASIGEFAAL
jgi:hypothetical protein